jgi:RNA 2',3'-cyclic 3'-phosphodiesterase
MSQQLSLPGLQGTTDHFDLDIPAQRGRPQHYKMFFGLFLPPSNAQHLANDASALCLQHGLIGECLAAERLHITLHVVCDLRDTVPLAVVDAARIAAATVDCASLHITFDQALSFRPNGAFVLRCDARSDATIARLRQMLSLALRRVGLRTEPSRTPHMTLLYSGRFVPAKHIQPIEWTAREFALVLSHTGQTHHQWIDRWPLVDRR